MPQFMLLLHDSPTASPDLSPAEIERIIQEYTRWRESLEREGRLIGSNKLRDDGGKNLMMDQGQVRVIDGPYSEGKEVVGGYFIVEARDYEEAVEISRNCPHLSFGGRIELRAVEEMYAE